ncbi:UvrD-helicase domain-containing protein, partial [Halorhodospira neutriphila]|nr:hypothetical protein [Halorhodospira neutriphila]
MSEPFAIESMPLDGLRLIEASAGTGKTFSLAGLYLRLLVERRLAVHQILVMTFTRAATQELRERIRTRLVEAARLAAEPQAWPACQRPEERTAVALFEASPEGPAQLAERLRDAAARMDEATITTIHGFAQQAAAENAFDGGLPFDRGEQADDEPLFREAAADYWRSQVIGQPAAQAEAFRQLWDSPGALHETLRPVLAKPHAGLAGPPAGDIAERAERARALWREEGAELERLLLAAEAEGALLKGEGLDQDRRRHGGMAGLLGALADGLAGTAAGHAALPGWIADLASDAGARRHLKKAPAQQWCRPQELALVQALAELQPLGRLAAIREALARVRAEALARKRERRQFSFADLIEGLHAAITAEPDGEHLAASLHETWPWALVDEFQDTDPLQYEILRRIYAGREGGGLLMIGDPKQAIYGFRGGDVFAYLKAAAAAHGRYHLGTNFRATPELLRAVEAVFAAGGREAFLIPGIELHPVRAGRPAGDAALLRRPADGGAAQPWPALTLWPLEGEDGAALGKGEAEERLLEAAVAQIQHLLDGSAVLRRQRGEGEAAERPVAPADIAVLVNTNSQASRVQAALSRRGVPAVCLHQDSVYASAEAQDVLRLLQAAAAPADEPAVRAALATALEGYRLGDLIALGEDEAAWQAVLERYQRAHERWRAAGVLALLEGAVQAAAPRLLGLEDGERRLTNYLQLAELLQEAEAETFGLDGLIRHLQGAIDEGGGAEAGEAEQLRLESDEALVRITTVHRVKGLQYPIVLVPFAPFLGTLGSPAQPPYVFHDGDGDAWLDYGAAADGPARAVREHKAEAVRLLYVALTRAEQACFASWGVATQAADSALAWLLHGRDGASAEAWLGHKRPPAWLEPATVRARLGEIAAAAPQAVAVEPPPRPLAQGRPIR